MSENILINESHVLYNCDLRSLEVIEAYISKLDRAKTKLILAANGQIDKYDVEIFKSLSELSLLQSDLTDLKNNIEKAKSNEKL